MLTDWFKAWQAWWWPPTRLALLTEQQLKSKAAAWQRARVHGAAGRDQGLCLMQVRIEPRREATQARAVEVAPSTQRSLGRELARALRDQDLLGEAGPGRFLIVLPGTPAAPARIVAERLSALVLEAQPRQADGTLLSLRVAVTFCAVTASQDLEPAWQRICAAPIVIPKGLRHQVRLVD